MGHVAAVLMTHRPPRGGLRFLYTCFPVTVAGKLFFAKTLFFSIYALYIRKKCIFAEYKKR